MEQRRAGGRRPGQAGQGDGAGQCRKGPAVSRAATAEARVAMGVSGTATAWPC